MHHHMSDNTQLINTLQMQLDQCMARRALLSTAIDALEVTVRSVDEAQRIDGNTDTKPVVKKLAPPRKTPAPVVAASSPVEFEAKKKNGRKKKGKKKGGVGLSATQALMASSEIPRRQPKWSKKARQEARERMQRYWAERRAAKTAQQATA